MTSAQSPSPHSGLCITCHAGSRGAPLLPPARIPLVHLNDMAIVAEAGRGAGLSAPEVWPAPSTNLRAGPVATPPGARNTDPRVATTPPPHPAPDTRLLPPVPAACTPVNRRRFAFAGTSRSEPAFSLDVPVFRTSSINTPAPLLPSLFISVLLLSPSKLH